MTFLTFGLAIGLLTALLFQVHFGCLLALARCYESPQAHHRPEANLGNDRFHAVAFCTQQGLLGVARTPQPFGLVTAVEYLVVCVDILDAGCSAYR